MQVNFINCKLFFVYIFGESSTSAVFTMHLSCSADIRYVNNRCGLMTNELKKLMKFLILGWRGHIGKSILTTIYIGGLTNLENLRKCNSLWDITQLMLPWFRPIKNSFIKSVPILAHINARKSDIVISIMCHLLDNVSLVGAPTTRVATLLKRYVTFSSTTDDTAFCVPISYRAENSFNLSINVSKTNAF